MKILIVEDDGAIATMLRRGLEDARYQVDHAQDGLEGLTLATENAYSLVVLDLMLPQMDGVRVCQALRAKKNRTPILMLTARDSVDDRVKGLDAGADDYLPKPFDFAEFLARVRALLRREASHKARVIRIGDLEIDSSARRVVRAGTEVGLSRREFDLLEALASREGQVLTRDAIQERVWQNEEATSSTVDVYIGMLRKKVEAGHAHKLIHTVHGVGYTLRAPHEDAKNA
jgi:DNA-binding response OmpR family regulator